MDLAELVSHVIGVDTHKHSHTAVVVDATTGGVVREAQATASTDRDGYETLFDLADEHSTGGERVWAIECTGSYGAGLTEFLTQRGEWVIEVDRPVTRARRDGAKSDVLDAVRSAREVLGRGQWSAPRARGEREAMRVLVATREGAVRDRTRAINQLKAMIVSAPEVLRDRLRGLTRGGLVNRCAGLRGSAKQAQDCQATVAALRRLARRIRNLDHEIREHDHDLRVLTNQHCPQIVVEYGVGHVTAAQAYMSWSHPGRCRNEAAFASLAGTAPIDASSGQVVRHRLNRGGDRRLNRVLHTVIVTRSRGHQPTQDYIARRVAEGKSEREARRCLKRYLARHIYRLLENQPQQSLDNT